VRGGGGGGEAASRASPCHSRRDGCRTLAAAAGVARCARWGLYCGSSDGPVSCTASARNPEHINPPSHCPHCSANSKTLERMVETRARRDAMGCQTWWRASEGSGMRWRQRAARRSAPHCKPSSRCEADRAREATSRRTAAPRSRARGGERCWRKAGAKTEPGEGGRVDCTVGG
jgi:hypothetical protein